MEPPHWELLRLEPLRIDPLRFDPRYPGLLRLELRRLHLFHLHLLRLDLLPVDPLRRHTRALPARQRRARTHTRAPAGRNRDAWLVCPAYPRPPAGADMAVTLRTGSPADAGAVRALLAEADLPVADLEDAALTDFVLAEEDGRLVGTVAEGRGK